MSIHTHLLYTIVSSSCPEVSMSIHTHLLSTIVSSSCKSPERHIYEHITTINAYIALTPQITLW